MRCPLSYLRRWKLALVIGSLLTAIGTAWPAEEGYFPVKGGRVWRTFEEWQGGESDWTDLVPPHLEYSEVRFKMGDDPRWARVDWDDARWARRGYYVPVLQGVMWVRFRVRDLTAPLPPAVYMVLSAAHELYWDGIPVGSSGVPGNDAATEKAGRIRHNYLVPETLRAPGEHVIALRMSTHRQPVIARNSTLLFCLTTPAQLEIQRWRFLAAPVMQVGAMALFALAAMVMWLVGVRRRALLYFGGVCVGCIGIQGSLIVEYTISRPYDIGFASLGLLVTSCSAMSLIALVAEQLNLRGVRWAVVGVVLAYLVLVDRSGAPWGSRPYLVMLLALLAALGYTVVGVSRKRRGAMIACVGVLLSVVVDLRSPIDFMRANMLVGFLPTELAMFALIALDLRDERRKAREAQLTAARLEVELLKQNLQPHFLMNTLTALAQTIRENPDRAMAFIEDLATEVRMLAGMAAEKHVTLGRELELCRTHLRVMRARTEVDWELQADGIDASALVPPALFLTLIENGFSHQRAERPATRFRLRARAETGNMHYEFFSPGVAVMESARVEGGTGLRYVRARLEESFPGRWTLSHGPGEGGWETRVDLRAAPAGGDRP
ncbi:MAG TPA: histidine kinase [Candidatus Didemnitutus sp.]|nr:histidine kinase [Candidatus Didemnitutus sp.]